MNFWETYEKLCLSCGKKPSPVGKELGISTGSIAQWKNGSTPSGETLVKIADYFGVTTDYLLGRTAEPSPTAHGHINGDNSFQNIQHSPVSNYQKVPENKPDSLTREFLEAFQGLTFSDKVEIMSLTMEKMRKGA